MEATCLSCLTRFERPNAGAPPKLCPTCKESKKFCSRCQTGVDKSEFTAKGIYCRSCLAKYKTEPRSPDTFLKRWARSCAIPEVFQIPTHCPIIGVELTFDNNPTSGVTLDTTQPEPRVVSALGAKILPYLPKLLGHDTPKPV